MSSKVNEPNNPPIVLTIAGFDPTAGAGTLADIKTFMALNCYGVAVTTAITVQDSGKVYTSQALAPELIAQTLNVLFEDLPIKAVKIGMLANEEVASVVANCLRNKAIPIVIDPLAISTSGYRLVTVAAEEIIAKQLFPLATLITPNLAEAEYLTKHSINNLADMAQAALKIYQMGPKAVLIKGGHLYGDPIDLCYDGEVYQNFSSVRLARSAHGTGCTLSAAIAAFLAQGHQILAAISQAKLFISGAIMHAHNLGQGAPLLNHCWQR